MPASSFGCCGSASRARLLEPKGDRHEVESSQISPSAGRCARLRRPARGLLRHHACRTAGRGQGPDQLSYEVRVSSRSIRGDALLASVKPGGGGWRTWNDIYRLAAGAIVSEATLGRVVLVERGRLRPGPLPGEGALEQLARQVEAEPRPKKLKHWLEWTAPWAQNAIGEELAAARLAQLVSRRFLRVFLREPYLEILDQRTQDEVYRLVRETIQGNHTTIPEAALLVLLVGSAGVLRYHVQIKRGREARRRFRELRASLPDDVQVVVRAYEKWEIRGAADG